ncbi:MAG: hypothetical protein LBV50_03090 [Novosphingobium sp.]|jgi:hypothetical protein|nr:hypothetical protein [Novosphingobium sp.]
MKLPLHFACLCLLPLALAGCKGEKKKTTEAGTAQGEILPGSASDAMLPLDSVRSQPPLAPAVMPGGKAAKQGGTTGDEAASTASEQAAAPAPAETPATSPAPAAPQ